MEGRDRQRFLALQRVGAAVNSSLEPAAVLDTVMDAIIGLTGAERSLLMLAEGPDGELKVAAARNLNRETIENPAFDISRSIVASVAEGGAPVVTINAQADPRFAGRQSIVSHNLLSILCVPLANRGRLIGVIYADNRLTAGLFSEEDRDALAAFADQAAVALENARLFAQTREQLVAITALKELQDNVFSSIPSGVLSLDSDGLIVLANQAIELILGRPAAELLGRPFGQLAEALGSGVEELAATARRLGQAQFMETQLSLPDRAGSAALRLTAAPLRDLARRALGVTLVIDDVTQQRRLDSVGRYLPPALVERIHDLDAAQQAQRRPISVLFGDVRGYTGISEQVDPEGLIEILNAHLSLGAQAISRYDGLIDKYDGDTVMALFNTPLNPQLDHGRRAVLAALEMRDLLAAGAGLSQVRAMRFGVGLHMGEAVVGNVGSPARKDYSAIGDAVNVAKRLQELAAPGQILLSGTLYQAVAEWVEARPLPPVRLKGRQRPEEIYELLGALGSG
ncbi:MAG: GAF domain-containing protein [Candidatus Promineifilaceae bacterium]